MDRTITIKIITENMPSSIKGFSMKTGAEEFAVFLNGHEDDPDTVGSFLHEMLHIYHGDLDKSLPSDQLEKERHREIEEVLEALRKREN